MMRREVAVDPLSQARTTRGDGAYSTVTGSQSTLRPRSHAAKRQMEVQVESPDVRLFAHGGTRHDESVAQVSTHHTASSDLVEPASQWSTNVAANTDKLLYIGVFSEPGEFQQRAATRNGWLASLKRQLQGSSEILVQFV